MLYTLFCFQVENVHSAEGHWSMSYSRRGHLVNTHFGEEVGEVLGLNLLAFLFREAGGTQWILYHRSPDGAEAYANAFTSKWSQSNFAAHLFGLLKSVSEFVDVIAIRCQSHTKGTLSFLSADALDGFGLVWGGARCQVYGGSVYGCGNHFGCAGLVESLLDTVSEAFVQVECPAGSV